jgi:hypothetical protein
LLATKSEKETCATLHAQSKFVQSSTATHHFIAIQTATHSFRQSPITVNKVCSVPSPVMEAEQNYYRAPASVLKACSSIRAGYVVRSASFPRLYKKQWQLR